MAHFQDAFDGIVHAHKVVRQAVVAILDAGDPGEAMGALRALGAVLPKHFEVEERPGGFFAHLRERQRHADGEIDALIAEHRVMEAALEALMEASALDEAWLERARAFARKLREHEKAEGRLGAEP